MSAFLIANMAPIIFASLVIFLLMGYPVAFSLAANGIVFGLLGIQLGMLSPELFRALPERVYGVMGNETLLAIPFFTFMGLILERSGMPRTCSTPSASCSARSAAGWPTPSCWWVRCSPPRPAWWPPR
jgi:TRAP-type mannitol/chloroaromatic compound transport system permease large subunit